MKSRRIFKLALFLGFMLTSQYALSAPMEGVDDATVSTKKTEKQKSSNILPIIALLVGASGAGTAVLAILKGNKAEEENKKLKAAFAKDKEGTKAEVSTFNNSVANLKSQLSEVRNDLARLMAMQRTSNSSYVGVSESRANELESTARVASQPRPQVSAPVKEYFGIPNQGLFSTPSSNYVVGKTLYCVQGTSSDNTAQFSFIDNADAASIAARSITRFVECGCVVRGEIRNNFSKVVTVKPGTVIKIGSGWRIETKAVVELR